MTPRDQRQNPQRDLLNIYLDDVINMRHELVQMSQRIELLSILVDGGQAAFLSD